MPRVPVYGALRPGVLPIQLQRLRALPRDELEMQRVHGEQRREVPRAAPGTDYVR